MSLATFAARQLRGVSMARNTVSVMRDPLRFLDGAARTGDAVRLEFGAGKRTLLLNHPRDIEQVLVKHRVFPKHHPLLPEMKRFTGEGLATSDGDLWKRQRKLIQPLFARERVTRYTDDMATGAARTVDGWQPGEVRNLFADVMRLALAGTARTLFSVEVGDEATAVMEAVTVVMEHFARPLFIFAPWINKLPLPQVRRVQTAKARIDAVVDALVAERSREAGAAAARDLLGALLAARDDDGAAMSARQLHDEVVTFYIAGYEPTAVALAWTLQLLIEHPHAMAQASDEARALLNGRPATSADLPRLPYIGHVVDESLRLYPPAWSMVREAAEPCRLGGEAVAAGDQLWLSPWVVHRDRRWFDAPLAFRPERWADGLEKRLPGCAYFPYGSGPRICVGASLAKAQLPTMVATILARAQLEALPGRERALPSPSINLRPTGGVWARVRARS